MFTDKSTEKELKTFECISNLGLPSRFTVKCKIGQGGMGEVYRAFDSQLDRDVAIKMLHRDLALTQDGQKRFLREARTLATLAHANILRIHMFGLTDGDARPFQVADFLEGESLADRLAADKTLSNHEFSSIFIGILNALEYSSSQGIIHRDIKPSNIFLTRDADGMSNPVLLDFGIATTDSGVLNGEKTRTATGGILGSPLYMSPEQCRGEAVSITSDIYSLGTVMYECLTGCPPYAGENALETMYRRMSSSVPTLHSYVGGTKCQLGLSRVVLSCLNKDKSQRPQTIAQLRADFIKAANEIPEGTSFRVAPVAGKKSYKLALSILCSVALLGACAIMAVRGLEQIRNAETAALITKKVQNESLEQMEEDFYRAHSLYKVSSPEQKEAAAKSLMKKIQTIRGAYWRAEQYDKWFYMTDKCVEACSHMVNGKSRLVDVYIENFFKSYELIKEGKNKQEMEKGQQIAKATMNELDAILKNFEDSSSRLDGQIVHTFDLLRSGHALEAKQAFLIAWASLQKQDRSVAAEFFFTGDVKKDWRYEKAKFWISEFQRYHCWKTPEDALILCEIIAPLAEFINNSRDQEECLSAKLYGRQLLNRVFPTAPKNAELLKRYDAVLALLQDRPPKADRDDFWKKNNMKPAL